MIAGERTTAYINSLDRGNTELLNQIEREAKEACVPIIRQEMQSLLKTLLAAKKPKAVLEVGTAVGFSALLMCEYGPRDMRLTTIEKYEKRIPVAKENFRRAGREGQITFLEGDAAEILSRLTGSYDFIFMDAAKAQYIYYLPEALRLLRQWLDRRGRVRPGREQDAHRQAPASCTKNGEAVGRPVFLVG